MPTILTIFAWRVAIYPNDHRPAHVHVLGGGCEAVFHLRCPDGPPVLRENYGFSRGDLNRVLLQLEAHLAPMCRAWRALYGDF